ncbi:MAG: hypothetical protein R2939_00660 [Kofleriaceae bacterium]
MAQLSSSTVLRPLLAAVVAGGLTLVGNVAQADEYYEFTQADVDKAVRAKDIKTLENYCWHNSDLDDAWRSSCRALIAHHEAKADGAYLMRVCNGNEKQWHTDFYEPACVAGKRVQGAAFQKELADCGKLAATWEKYSAELRGDAQDELFYAVGLRAAECKQWNMIWVDLAHQSPRGGELLARLAAAKVDVEAELMAYLKATKKPFAFEHGFYAIENISSWLIAAGKVGDCKRFIPYAKASPPDTLGAWLHFFSETECSAAAPLAQGRLKSKDPAQRRQACAVLGVIGSKKDIAKLKVLAKKDPEYKKEVIGGVLVKTYWVREACDAAIGQIQLQ